MLKSRVPYRYSEYSRVPVATSTRSSSTSTSSRVVPIPVVESWSCMVTKKYEMDDLLYYIQWWFIHKTNYGRLRKYIAKKHNRQWIKPAKKWVFLSAHTKTNGIQNRTLPRIDPGPVLRQALHQAPHQALRQATHYSRLKTLILLHQHCLHLHHHHQHHVCHFHHQVLPLSMTGMWCVLFGFKCMIHYMNSWLLPKRQFWQCQKTLAQ